MKIVDQGKRIALAAGFLLIVLGVTILVSFRGEIREWYEFRQIFESLGKNEQGLPEYRHKNTGIVFVSLPGGTFSMGSPGTETRRMDTEGPAHEVQLNAFLIAKYEVTQEMWEKVMGNNPSRFKGQKRPVDQVSWNDCQEFCTRSGLSLPTEAQWEYACRAGTQTPFWFGAMITTDQVNHDGSVPYGGGKKGMKRGATLPVDALKPNGFGLYNMHGNLWEWCVDSFDARFYSKPEALEKDPVCTSGWPTSSEIRVIRGGGWGNYAEDCRSARRSDRLQRIPGDHVGFRPVWPPR